MSYGQKAVTLQRDGQGTAWGFRLQGGRDIGAPLTIQRVFLGSPSEGELARGDLIMRIGNREANKLSHQEAHNLIKNQGNVLQLVIHRGPYYSPRGSDASQTSPYGPGVALPAVQSPYVNPVQALPKTQFGNEPRRQFVPNAPPTTPGANTDDFIDVERERIAVTNQPHRTFPLIQPGSKVRQDLPTGSYLRFVNDPFVRAPPPSSMSKAQMVYQANDALMKARISETVQHVASNSSSIGSPVRGRSETPDYQVVQHRQYNSPLNLYSPQNVAATIQGQTGVTMTPIPSGPIKITSITKSPTYQTIYEAEWKELRKDELKEHKPVQQKLKELPPPLEGFNPLGTPRCRITQSKTFEMIEDTLRGETNF